MTQQPPPKPKKTPTSLYGARLVIQRMEKSAKYQPSGASPSLVRSWARELRAALRMEMRPNELQRRKRETA